MPLQGEAAVAMWWNVAGEHLEEFQEWHSKEHLPERLGIPGFRRGSRWKREQSGEFFVIYELEVYETLVSEPYRARLNAPTPWSTAMMPHHRDMVRSQCRIVASHGRGLATCMSPTRLSPTGDGAARLDAHLREVLAQSTQSAGITGAALLRTETPKSEPTREQRIRGGDAVADWIVLLSGHDAAALAAASTRDLGEETLRAHGAGTVRNDGTYRLVHAMTPQDLER